MVELASNDGYLLQYFVARGVPVLGIEPAANVARAAIESGVSRKELDLDEYSERLRQKVEAGRSLVSVPLNMARDRRSRIAIPDGHLPRLISIARRTHH